MKLMIYTYIILDIKISHFYKWRYCMNVLFMMRKFSIKNVAVAEKRSKTLKQETRKVASIFSCNLNIEHHFAVQPLSLVCECCLVVIFSLFSQNPDYNRENLDCSRTRVQDRRSQEIISVSVVTCTM